VPDTVAPQRNAGLFVPWHTRVTHPGLGRAGGNTTRLAGAVFPHGGQITRILAMALILRDGATDDGHTPWNRVQRPRTPCNGRGNARGTFDARRRVRPVTCKKLEAARPRAVGTRGIG
jgi:hypothetical protein